MRRTLAPLLPICQQQARLRVGRLCSSSTSADVAVAASGHGRTRSFRVATKSSGLLTSPALLSTLPVTAAPSTVWRMGWGTRSFSTAQKEGTVKMWNEDKGFGFISPADGGPDVFVHRTSLNEGVMLAAGQAVSFEPVWDDKKRKDRAGNVSIAALGNTGSASGSAGATSPSVAASSSTASSFNIVASSADWAIHAQSMASEGSGVLRHRLTVRSGGGPKSGGRDATKREEFQIVGDGTWDKRLYPTGPDKEEVVVLRPGGAPSRASMDKNRGHGRNWAVEGPPGAVFDILYDPQAQTVSCEQAFNEASSK